MRPTKDISIIEIYSHSNADQWNQFLSKCAAKGNINLLAETRTALQKDMDSLARQKLNSDSICVFYIRLIRSLEQTAKFILRKKYPNPLHGKPNPAPEDVAKWNQVKKFRAQELEKFLQSKSY